MNKAERLAAANAFIRVIASCGRRTFALKDRVAHIEADARGRLWWMDEYKGDRLYMHVSWLSHTKFSHGGTMNALARALRDFVMRGEHVPSGQLWFPKWACDGDVWGYGADMEIVRKAYVDLGLNVDQKGK